MVRGDAEERPTGAGEAMTYTHADLSPCVEWEGARHPQGYGRTWVDGKSRRAHRVAWEETNGPIPEGMWVLHKCDNPPCVNIDHLFLGTAKDNAQDTVQKGRHSEQAKTCCPQGHPYSGDNLFYGSGGERKCRTCSRAQSKKYRSAL